MTRLFEKEYGLPVNSNPTDPRSRAKHSNSQNSQETGFLSPIQPDLCTEFGLVGDCLLNFGPLVSARSGSGRRLRILRSKSFNAPLAVVVVSVCFFWVGRA